MKTLLIASMLFFSVNVISQNYYFTKSDSSLINVIHIDENYIFFISNNYLYKLSYDKTYIDSVYINQNSIKTINNNDTLLLVGCDSNYSRIEILMVNKNLQILNYKILQIDSLPAGYYIIDVYPLKNSFLITSGTNSLGFNIFVLDYNLNVIRARNFPIIYNFSFYANNNIYLFYDYSRPLELMILDTTLQMLDYKYFEESSYYVTPVKYCLYKNNKVCIYGCKSIDGHHFLSLSITSLNYDTTYYEIKEIINNTYIFNYPSAVVAKQNYIYTTTLHDFNIFYTTTTHNSLYINLYDSLLNLKWEKYLEHPNYNFQNINAFIDYKMGIIFSITYTNLTDFSKHGAIVRLDSLGNFILSYPNNFLNNNVNVYPNPGTNELNVLLPENHKNTTFELINSLGILCTSQEFTNDQLKVNTSNLCSGIYFYRLRQGNEIISQGKWIKQ
jgi:hypothetical protein